eukprot:1462-Heterococcus_DN1.PRE.1
MSAAHNSSSMRTEVTAHDATLHTFNTNNKDQLRICNRACLALYALHCIPAAFICFIAAMSEYCAIRHAVAMLLQHIDNSSISWHSSSKSLLYSIVL